MSFKTKLAVAGKEYTVLNVNYGLFQETDATGSSKRIKIFRSLRSKIQRKL